MTSSLSRMADDFSQPQRSLPAETLKKTEAWSKKYERSGLSGCEGCGMGNVRRLPKADVFDPHFLARAPITLLSNVTSSAFHTNQLLHIPTLLVLPRCSSGYVPLVVV